MTYSLSIVSMHLTPLQKDLYKFASPSRIRPALNCVLFNGWRAVATDSFRLVEVIQKKTTGAGIPDTMIYSDSLKAIKTDKKDTAINLPDNTINTGTVATTTTGNSHVLHTHTVPHDEYPKYETIKDAAEQRSYVEVNLSGEYLAEIAEYLARFDDKGAIKLRVPLEKNQAVILESSNSEQSAYAILMPLHK